VRGRRKAGSDKRFRGGDGRSGLTYVKPSSLMVVEPNHDLLSAAKELDAKLAALAAKVTGVQ
jgi:hypothetical protein